MAERRAAQDHLAGVARDPVREVRLAAGDQRDVALGPARVVQRVGEQRTDDVGLGAGRDRLEALRGRIVEPAAGDISSTGVPDGGAGERAPERPLVVRRIAELPLAHDDPAQEPMGRMLRRHGDAAEHLHRAVGDLAGCARHVRLGDRSRPLRLARRPRRAPPPRRGPTTTSWPGARTCRPAGGAAPGSCRSCDRTGAARRRSGTRRRACAPPLRPPPPRRAGRRSSPSAGPPRRRAARTRPGLRRTRPRTSAPSGRGPAAAREATPGAPASTTPARALRRGRDHGEARDGAGMLHGGLAPGDGVAAGDGLEHGAIGAAPSSIPARARASATASSPSSAASGAAAKRTAALPRYGTGARRAPSARAIRHSSTAPSPSSPPTDSAPNSTRLAHSRPCSRLAREQRVDRFAEPPSARR